MARRLSPRLNAVIAVALAIGLGVSVALIVLGGRSTDEPDQRAKPVQSERSGSQSSRPPKSDETLPVGNGSAAALSELTDLAFPPDMTGFRSATIRDGAQVDIIFDAPPESTATFIEKSGLPQPVTDERMLTHSSPLWELNPELGSKLSGAQDDRGKVHRAVELIEPGAADDEDAEDAAQSDGNDSDAGEPATETGIPATDIPDGMIRVRISITPSS